MKSAKRKDPRVVDDFKAEEDRRESHPVAHGIGLIMAMLFRNRRGMLALIIMVVVCCLIAYEIG